MARNLTTGLQRGLRRSLRPGLGGGDLFTVAPLDLNFARYKTLDPRITFTRASSGTYVDSAGALQTAATNEARFTHDPTTGESLGLLVEEQRTNLLLNSATLSTQNVTVAAAAHTLSFTGTGTITLSGTSTAGPLVGAGIGESNRVKLTFTPTAGTLTLTVSGTVSNAQLESGAFATSYIPTTTSAVTRAADVASISGSNFSSWYRQDEGSFLCSSALGPLAATNRAGFDVNDGSTNNRIILRVATTGNADQLTVRFGGTTVATIATGSSPAVSRHAIGSATDNFAICRNGSDAIADTSVSAPSGCSQLLIGSAFGGGEYINGTIRRLTYWPQRLPNSTLQAITR
jgi:hypothetical protein